MLLVFIFICLTSCDILSDNLNKLQKKVCPFVDLDGVSHKCASTQGTNSALSPELLTLDAMSGFNTYPIIDLEKTQGVVNRTGLIQTCVPHVFNNIPDFYSQFYDLNKITTQDTWTYYNGMFRQDSVTQDILPMMEAFVAAPQRQILTSSQQLYSHYTITVDITKVQLKDEFVQIVNNFLPATYDATIYKKFVEAFGTHAATSCDYGGMMEQDNFIKECDKDTLFTSTFTQDLCADLGAFIGTPDQNIRGGSANYQRSSTVKRKRIVGGNPILSEPKEWKNRISTFAQDPVGIKCIFHPITAFVHDATKKANVQKFLASYVAAEAADRKAKFDAERAKQKIPMVIVTTAPGMGYEYAIGVPGASAASGAQVNFNFPYSYHCSGRRRGIEGDYTPDDLLQCEKFFTDRDLDLFNMSDPAQNHWTEDGHGTIVFGCKCKADRSCGCWEAGVLDKNGNLAMTDFKNTCYGTFKKVLDGNTVAYVKSGPTDSGCITSFASLYDYYYLGYPYTSLPGNWAVIKTFVNCEQVKYIGANNYQCACQLS